MVKPSSAVIAPIAVPATRTLAASTAGMGHAARKVERGVMAPAES